MLNPFPIQFLAPLAYFLIRITLGFVCVRTGAFLLRDTASTPKRKLLGTFLLVTGTALIFGFYTQVAALITFVITLFGMTRTGGIPRLTRTSLLLMAAMSISLFITGAGPFAFDLPI
jgi:energy-converting hydrogenase Eha subunit E